MDKKLKSLYYYLPGQDPARTRIDDTSKALEVNPQGWDYITRHLTKAEKEEQAIADEQARKQYLKEGSYNMTKHWDNSIEKIRQRRLEEHENRIKAQKEERMARFLEITREQEQVRQKYIQDVKKRMFTAEENQRNLNSGLMMSETMYERGLQRAFNEKLRDQEAIDEANYARKVFREAEEERLGNNEKQRKRKEMNLQHKADLTEQVQSREDQKTRESEKNRKEEILDNMLALQEQKDLKKFEDRKIKAKRADMKRVLQDFQASKAHRMERERQEEILEDKLIEIYNNAKCTIDWKRKEKMVQLSEERKLLTDNVANKVKALTAGKDEEEREILERAIKEKEDLKIEREENDKRNKERLKQDRIDDRKKWLEKERSKKLYGNEKEKFLFLNRIKNDECYKKHLVEQKIEDKSKRVNYAKELKLQMKERKMMEDDLEQEELDALQYQLDKNAEQDRKYFEYSDEVLHLVKSRDRDSYPIEVVIEKYKMENNLKVKRKNISQLDSSVPINEKPPRLSRKGCICNKNYSTLSLE